MFKDLYFIASKEHPQNLFIHVTPLTKTFFAPKDLINFADCIYHQLILLVSPIISASYIFGVTKNALGRRLTLITLQSDFPTRISPDAATITGSTINFCEKDSYQ